ncbi:hypothetical protein HOK021_23800 [Streptomyces hygroscopicus]|nr:hypothetical protein HOK021_23800 [Streptomyces hygroscopicus]
MAAALTAPPLGLGPAGATAPSSVSRLRIAGLLVVGTGPPGGSDVTQWVARGVHDGVRAAATGAAPVLNSSW